MCNYYDDVLSIAAIQLFSARTFFSYCVHTAFVLIQGLLRSHVTCPMCQHASVTFDPYTSLSLPLPVEDAIMVRKQGCLDLGGVALAWVGLLWIGRSKGVVIRNVHGCDDLNMCTYRMVGLRDPH